MPAHVDSGVKAFTASGAIAQYLRVKLVAGQLAIAGATDRSIGVIRDAAFLAGDFRGVYLRNKPGTIVKVANGAITAGDRVVSAASGKVTNVSGAAVGSYDEGIALTAATADGDWVEVLEGGGGGSALKMAEGQHSTVAASDTIATGLSLLIGVVATLNDDAGLNPGLVTASIGDQAAAPAAGSFLLKTWQFTSNANPTPIAATTFTKKVNWLAFGY